MQKSAADERPPGGAGWWREWPWSWEQLDDDGGDGGAAIGEPGGDGAAAAAATAARRRRRRLLSVSELHGLRPARGSLSAFEGDTQPQPLSATLTRQPLSPQGGGASAKADGSERA